MCEPCRQWSGRTKTPVRRSVRFWSQKRHQGGNRGRPISSSRCQPLLRVFVVSGSLRPAGAARDNQTPSEASSWQPHVFRTTPTPPLSAQRLRVEMESFESSSPAKSRQPRAFHCPNSTCSRVQLHMLGDTCLRTRQRPSLHWCDRSQRRMRTSKYATARSSVG